MKNNNQKKQNLGINSAKALVQRYSRGSVGLQIGRFVTGKEKSARKKRVLEMKFLP